MATFFIIVFAIIILSGYIRLVYIEDEIFSGGEFISILAISLIIGIAIIFIIDTNRDYKTVNSKEEICPEIKEEITITNGDTVKTTTYIYTFSNE